MRNPLADKCVEIKPSGIRKFFDIAAEMDDVISLGVGEPDFDTPWHVRDEGIYSLEKGRTSYTSNAGLKELKEEISKFLYSLENVIEYEILPYHPIGNSKRIALGLQPDGFTVPSKEFLKEKSKYVFVRRKA